MRKEVMYTMIIYVYFDVLLYIAVKMLRERCTRALKAQLGIATRKSYEKGIEEDQIGDVEDTFNIAINIYSL